MNFDEYVLTISRQSIHMTRSPAFISFLKNDFLLR